jgi:flavin-dependent dehydrogenase
MEALSMDTPEVIIIGAGPAGALSARLLARAGVRVLLTDRGAFPRPKLCGGCLTQSGIDLLASHGLSETTSITNAPMIDRLVLHSGAQRLSLTVPPYRVIDRARFDQDLVDSAMRAGARFAPETQTRVLPDHAVELQQRCGARKNLTPAVIIVADGIKGTSLRDIECFAWLTRPGAHIGFGAIASVLPSICEQDSISMHHFHSGYAGIAPLGDGRAIIAAAADPAWIKQQHDAKPLDALLRALSIDIHSDTVLRVNPGAPGLTRQRAVIETRGRIFLIGDATGYVEPFTGEGMTWALADADMIRDHTLAALSGAYRQGQWTTQHRRLNRRRKLLCRSTARVLRVPHLTRAVVSAGSRSKVFSGGLACAVGALQRQNLPRVRTA